MELLHGSKSLTAYTDGKRMSARERLAMMAAVCDAVHHAHQRGIIHRDLKPGNILVDDHGQPKILDFGVARLTDSDAQLTLQTIPGQLVGTLAYMSPEQAMADPLELDIRSDVYALGVILYELLSGKLPYTLSHKLEDALRTIREQDPPSLTVATRAFSGDVDTIVAKALEKDKTRRYASAAELAAEIRRYLKNEPILARPASTTYQLKKFAQRNKAFVLGTLAVFLVLVIGAIASTWQALRARRAEVQARQEAANSKAVSGFLQDMLGSADPFASERGNANGRDVTVAQTVNQALRNLDSGALKDQPLVEAAVRQTIGQTLQGLGNIQGGETQMRKALALRRAHLPAASPEIAKSLQSLAVLLQNKQNGLKEAEASIREALALHRNLFGNESREVAESEANLSMMIPSSPERLPLIQDAVRLSRRLNGEDARTGTYLAYLSGAYVAQAKYREAETPARQALEIRRRILPENHPDISASLQQLSTVLLFDRRYREAEPPAREALVMAQKVLGEHLQTARNGMRLAQALAGQGRNADAEAQYAESIAMLGRLVGDAPALGVPLQNYSLFLRQAGKLEAAEENIQHAIAIFRKAGAEQKQNLATSLDTLGLIRQDQGRFAEAEALERDSLAQLRDILGDRHPFVARVAGHLGEVLRKEGKLVEAEQLLK
jgi:eukaryotic-like serine/threonine-protein kinase